MSTSKAHMALLPIRKRGPHAASTCLIVPWMAIVVGTVMLLEHASHAFERTTIVPWYYRTDGLPPLLLTLIAQTHAGVTAMHLARLAVSAVATSHGAPRTWAELFWLAERKWSGPVGIIEVLWSLTRIRVRRLSYTFLIFSLVSGAAITLPVALQNAYPVAIFDVAVAQKFSPYSVARTGLDTVGMYSQISSGSGTWLTNLTVTSLSTRTAYIPAGHSRNGSASDVFFAGDVGRRDVTLPGIRIQGQCVDMAVDQSMFFRNDTVDRFREICEEGLPSPYFFEMFDLTENFLLMGYCLPGVSNTGVNTTHSYRSNGSNITAFIMYMSQGLSVSDTAGAGITRCEAKTLFGSARLDGREMLFSNFTADGSLRQTDIHLSEPPIIDPLAATIRAIAPKPAPGYSLQSVTVDSYLRVKLRFKGQDPERVPPTPEQFAQTIWNGATHMAAALATIGRVSDIEYDAIAYTSAPRFRRNEKYFYVAVGLIGFWAVGLVLASGLLFRPTFADSLDSYAAARLLVLRPDLVEGVSAGPLDENERLAGRFDTLLRLCRSDVALEVASAEKTECTSGPSISEEPREPNITQ